MGGEDQVGPEPPQASELERAIEMHNSDEWAGTGSNGGNWSVIENNLG